MVYKFLEHTADAAFEVRTNSLNKLFVDSIDALLVLIKDNVKIKCKKEKKIKIKSSSIEKLLHNFMEEILVILDSDNFIVSKIRDLKIDEKKCLLSCCVCGDDVTNYNISNDVKAISYNTELEHKKNWYFKCIVDV